MAGNAQRANEVVYALALAQLVQLHGGAAHDLEDDGHGARLTVIVRHGQGDALGILLGAHDDELAGLGLLCHQRCLNHQLGDGGVQLFSFNDLKHGKSLPFHSQNETGICG